MCCWVRVWAFFWVCFWLVWRVVAGGGRKGGYGVYGVRGVVWWGRPSNQGRNRWKLKSFYDSKYAV